MLAISARPVAEVFGRQPRCASWCIIDATDGAQVVHVHVDRPRKLLVSEAGTSVRSPATGPDAVGWYLYWRETGWVVGRARDGGARWTDCDRLLPARSTRTSWRIP